MQASEPDVIALSVAAAEPPQLALGASKRPVVFAPALGVNGKAFFNEEVTGEGSEGGAGRAGGRCATACRGRRRAGAAWPPGRRRLAPWQPPTPCLAQPAPLPALPTPAHQ